MQKKTIAIVGMDCNLPNASSVEGFWSNLCNKQSGILRLEGANRVGMHVSVGYLDDFDCFDYHKFHMGKREACLIAPQHRLFLSCSAKVLENFQKKSITDDEFVRKVGVFGSCPMDTYLQQTRNTVDTSLHTLEGLQATLQNDKDYIGLRTSHVLNLHGPSIDIQTSCSSSAVAVHYACLSLAANDCDLAIAGGATMMTPQLRPYKFVDGSIFSSDGHCRPFTVDATGTVHGNGAAVILLKRLDDALRDENPIFGIIVSSAINNNGNRQNGFTAPSVDGWCEVIEKALTGIDVETIGIIETHGTATKLGDKAEFEAINRVFSSKTTQKGFCSIGTAKSHIGHQEATCGVINILKACCSLTQSLITSDVYDSHPIDFSETPFYFPLETKQWKRQDGKIRRISINSSGMGGTNVHLVIEEAPLKYAAELSDLRTLRVQSEKTPRCWFISDKITDLSYLGLRLKNTKNEIVYEQSINLSSFIWLKDHILSGTPLIPGTYFVSLLNAAAASIYGNSRWKLEAIEFKEILPLSDDKVVLRTTIRKNEKSWDIQIESQGSDVWEAKVHAVASVSEIETEDFVYDILHVSNLLRENQEPLNISDIYENQAEAGLFHGAFFQKIRHAVKIPQGILGVIADFEGHLLQQIDREVCLLDSCLQLFRFVHEQTKFQTSSGYLLTSFESININAVLWKENQGVWCLAKHREKTEGNKFITDYVLFSEDGYVIGEIRGAQEKGVSTRKKSKIIKSQTQNITSQYRKLEAYDYVLKEFKQLIADTLSNEVNEISPDDTLGNLGIDSFSTLEIGIEIQNRLRSSNSFLDHVRPEYTIQQIVDSISKQLGKGNDDPFPTECDHE